MSNVKQLRRLDELKSDALDGYFEYRLLANGSYRVKYTHHSLDGIAESTGTVSRSGKFTLEDARLLNITKVEA